MTNRHNSRNPLIKLFILTSLILGSFLNACSVTAPDTQDDAPPAASATIEKEPDPIPTPEATENLYGDWMEYTNEIIGFRLLYPSSWYGPDAYESEGSLRLQVGSDQVYPYGTDRTEQITTVPDSYYITIQYFENIQGRTWDDFISSGWIDTYLELLKMEDGKSTSTARSLIIRVERGLAGRFPRDWSISPPYRIPPRLNVYISGRSWLLIRN